MPLAHGDFDVTAARQNMERRKRQVWKLSKY